VEDFSNVQFSPAGTLLFSIEGVTLDNGSFMRGKTTSTIAEIVAYVYVDRDTTITGGSNTVTHSNLSLNLKQGWNAVYIKSTPTKYSVSLGNPSNLYWVLYLF